MHVNEISAVIVHEALMTHQELGPGLLESVYESVLFRKLVKRGLAVDRQLVVPLEKDGVMYPEAFRLDLLVGHQVVVEVKSVEAEHPAHLKQVLTYLKILDLQVGLLINFGRPRLKDGLKRVVNGYREPGGEFPRRGTEGGRGAGEGWGQSEGAESRPGQTAKPTRSALN